MLFKGIQSVVFLDDLALCGDETAHHFHVFNVNFAISHLFVALMSVYNLPFLIQDHISNFFLRTKHL